MKQLLIHLLVVAGWLSSGAFLRAGGVVQDCAEAGLREALRDGGVVTFACDGVIELAQPIVISADTVIDASGREVTLSGRQAVRLFEVRPGATLQLVKLTLTQGRAEEGGAVFCDAATLILDRCTFVGHQAVGVAGGVDQPGTRARGGALFASASAVQVSDCLFTENQAMGGPGGTSPRQGGRGGTALGGAICITGGTLRVSDSKFLDNTAQGGAGGRGIQGGNGGDAFGGAAFCESDDVEWTRTEVARGRARGGAGGPGSVQAGPIGGGQGGGLYQAAGLMQLTACTVASCEAAGSPPNRARGGGLFNLATLLAFNTTVVSNFTSMVPEGESQGGGLYNEGFVIAEHCTVAANAATGVVQDKGGNLENAGGYVALRGTIIAYCRNQWDVFGEVIDQGGNICWDATAHFTDPTSRNQVDPKLGPLADNGGPVRTMLPLPGSPAVDAVKTAGTLTQDARGMARPAGASADAGAVEGSALAPLLAASFEPSVVRTGAVAWLRFTVLNPNPFALHKLSLRPTLPARFTVAPAPTVEVGCGGTAQAAPGATKPSVTFPTIGPLASCSFSVPIMALTPSTGAVTLASTTSENLGTLTGATTSATIKAMASAMVVTLPAESRADGSIVLKGRAYPLAQGGIAYFEYGPGTTYSLTTEVQTLAPGVSEVAIEATLSALAEATQYHARLVMVELDERVLGNEVIFATPSRGGGTALAFDGAAGWVKVEPALASVTDRFTIEFWAWPTAGQALPPGGEGTSGVYLERPLRFAVYPAHGTREFGAGHAGVGVSVSTNGVVVFERGQDRFPPVLIYAGTLTNWTHVAVTYGDGPPRLYLNMTLVRTGLTNEFIHHPSIEIGSSHDSPEPGNGFYQGYLDEVRIWDRVLSSQELLLLAGTGVAGTTPGLVAMLHLDEGAGVTVEDATGHGFDGEVLNSAVWLPSSAPMGAGIVQTSDALEVTAQAAVLAALVYVGEATGRVRFEWGAVSGTLQSTETQEVTSGSGIITNKVTLTGLRPAMAYRVQAVLEAGGATLRGGWRQFETGTTPNSTYALRLGGGSEAVRVGTPFADLTDNFTVEFWVRPTNHRPVTTESATGAEEVTGQPFAFYPQYGAEAYGGSHAVAGIAVGTNGVSVFEHGAFYRPSVLVHAADLHDWVHVAVVYRQRQASLLLNGVPVREGQVGPKPVHPSGDLACTTAALGEITARPVGDLDEVRIWSVARSVEEIRQNMHRHLTGTEAGLVLYYDFNAGPGAEVLDQSAAARRGQVAGNPTWVKAGPLLDSALVLSTSVTTLEKDRATLAGLVDPLGHAATAQFEWGPTPAYGFLTPPHPLASTTQTEVVTANLDGLSAGTTYFCRLVLERAGHFAVSDGFTLTTLPDGRGGALAFDGIDDFVTAPNAFGAVQGTFTMELWVKPSAGIALLPEGSNPGGWPTDQRLAIFPNEGASAYGAGHATAGLSVGTNGVNLIEHAPSSVPTLITYPLPLNHWTHLAVVYLEGQPSLFINGRHVRTGVRSASIAHPGSPLGSAALNGSTGFYAGLLDEVRIWAVARTPEQIRTNRHQILSGSEPGLVRYWRLDEADGDIVHNAVARPDQGTIQGALRVSADYSIGCAYVDEIRLLSSGLDGVDLELLVQGNGSGGSLRVEWGSEGTFGSLTEPVVIAPTDVDRWATFHIGGSGLGPSLSYRAAMDTEGAVYRELDGQVALFAPTQGTLLEFDGLSGSVTLPVTTFSGFTTDFTLDFWCQPTAARSDSVEQAGGASALGTQQFVLYPDYGPSFLGNNTVGVGVSVGTNGITVVEHGANRWAPVLVHTQSLVGWNHVAVAYLAGRPRLFLNGELAREGLKGDLSPGPGYHLGGGPPVLATACYYQGRLDEFRVWSRALTAVEIGMAIREAVQPPRPGLVWCQHFDEGSGETTFDVVNPTRPGTLSSGVKWIAMEAPLIRYAPCTLLANGSAQLQFPAAPLRPLVLSWSADLTRWTPIETNLVPASGVFEYVDADVPSHAYRFYRVVSPP